MKILFIGNSHTFFNDMPATAADMLAELTGEKVDVTMLAYSYKELDWHMKSEYFAVRFNIMYGGYDYCVAQQAAHPFPGDLQTAEQLMRIADLCRSVGTEPVLIQTWQEKGKPEQQAKLSMGNARAARMTNTLLAPVGTVWTRLLKEHPEIDLYERDGEHAGPYGAYLEALTIVSAIMTERTGEAPDLSVIGCGARDYAAPEDIDYDAPLVSEDREETAVVLDEEKAEAIRNAVQEHFENMAGMLR